MVPPILEYLGALTLREAPGAELQLVDANQRRITAADVKGDLVGISVWTATAPWAYRFADACRARGLRVVLGGIHATALPAEAARHADAVVVGEAESVWGEVLRDAVAGRLRPRYDGVRMPLAGLPTPIDAKLKGQYHFRAFFTMRGCPYNCSFCTVRRFFGSEIRYRPVDEVAREIEERAGSIWFNGDDNIWGADPKRAIALFDAIAAGSRRSWYGFGDLRSIQGPEGEKVLKAARRSGLYSVWAGWESDCADTLDGFRATGKQGRDRLEAVKRIQGMGMEVVLFTMLGSREEGLDSFQRTLELADRHRVGIHPVLATPLPGTELYEKYEPHLLPGLGWDAFTGVRAVFEHPDPAATPVRREREYHALVSEIFSWSRILDRLRAIPRAGFPKTHLFALMAQIPMKVAYGKARAEWEAAHAGIGKLAAAPGRLVTAARHFAATSIGAWGATGLAWLAAHAEPELEALASVAVAFHGVEGAIEAAGAGGAMVVPLAIGARWWAARRARLRSA
jgi:radical SAM superfamily enzyme YgiQ (UPF0313 family)